MTHLKTCLEPVITAMSPEEKGLLYLILIYGKRLEEELGESSQDPNILAEWGHRARTTELADLLNGSFLSGLGLMDALAGRDDDYGAQLEYLIDKVLLKPLGVTRPIFKKSPDTTEGALLREQWICEKLLEAMWDRLPEEAKRELAKDIEVLLRKSGVDAATAARTTAAIVSGGLTAAKALLGFQFHILTAQLSNLLLRALVGRGLGFAANAALQRIAGVLFGPIGWVITLLLLIPTITGLLIPREFDKYIPAVFLVGLKRMQLNEGLQES